MPDMRLTVLGCSGSVSGPESPASGYLITAAGAPPIVVDLGGGTLGALQRYADPADATILLSHLHADHCLDVAGLLVWRRYHPQARPGLTRVHAPSDAALRLGVASAERGGEVDDVTDVLDLRPWVPGEALALGPVTVEVALVDHPCEAYAMRFTDADGTTLVYTGDTGPCAAIGELARGADVLLAEASWTDAPDRPVGVHLSGTQAGVLAREAGVGRLLLTHVPPWTSIDAVVAEARAQYGGDVHAVRAAEEIELVPAQVHR